MPGEIQLNSTSFATESSGLITVKNSKLDTDAVFPTFVGLILPFAYNTSGSPPTGFFECDGSPVSRTTYSDLFSAIGTTWGVGDGSTTFNLPDLQGAFLRGTGSHGSSTMANSSAFAGPSVGSFENDQFQGHAHKYQTMSGGSTGGGNINTATPNFNTATTEADTATTYGTPRTGDETRPFNAGVMYCIKY